MPSAEDRGTPQVTQVQSEYSAASPRFANAVQCRAAQDHFVLDFIFLAEPSVQLARVVITPEHTKRLSDLLVRQVKAYEKQFGRIKSVRPTAALGSLKSTGRAGTSEKKKTPALTSKAKLLRRVIL